MKILFEASNQNQFALTFVFQTDFAVFSKVEIQTRTYDYRIVKLVGYSVTSQLIDIDTCNKDDCECEQWDKDSFDEAREYFDQLCVHLQHHRGYYRVQIAFEDAEHLQNACDHPNTQLNERVMDFLKRTIDRYLPLGIPHDLEIEHATNKLSKLFRAICNGRPFEIVSHLSNMYYQIMAHASGGSRKQIDHRKNDNRKNCRPTLDTFDLLNGKVESVKRVSSLLDAIRRGIAENVNPLDYIYHNYLNINLQPILSGSMEYREFIWKFKLAPISNRIRSVFKVAKSKWTESFRRDIGNQRYLLHSTHFYNAMNILRDGLQIAPDHVFSYNRWAGKGIYFHDRIDATSAFAQRLNHDIILVCRVALGDIEIIEKCPFNKDPTYVYPLPSYKHSLRQLGTGCCSNFEQFDEFIVQNADQVKIEFIVELN